MAEPVRIWSLLAPLQEGQGPPLPRFEFMVQQGPTARSTFTFRCPSQSVFSVKQMWAILAQMRRIAIRRGEGELTPRVWCYVDPNPTVPPPLYAGDCMMFP